MLAHLDCSTGVSGDKFLGALLDVGTKTGAFDAEHLQQIVSAVAPEAVAEVTTSRSHGIQGLLVGVRASNEPPSRGWATVRGLLEGAGLPDKVKRRSIEVFSAIAEAEAQAHGVDIDDVHFHEVGALDSIMDVVGVCAGLAALKIDRLIVTAPALGWGVVQSAHGVLPVPAPATATLLLGLPVVPGPPGPDGAEPGELTTPTGAALLRVLADGFGPLPPSRPSAVGYGLGTREIGSPNVCRLVLADEAPEPEVVIHAEEIAVLETNVDHISPEASAVACEQLLAEGAFDVWLTPIVMKKGRSAVMLSAVVEASRAEHFASRVIALTGSLGVRQREIPRWVAEREIVELETVYGTVRYKRGAGRVRPEADDVARIAREQSRPYTEVERELRDLLG